MYVYVYVYGLNHGPGMLSTEGERIKATGVSPASATPDRW